MVKRKLTNKTKKQILASDYEELSLYEIKIRDKIVDNPALSLKEIVENIIEDSDDPRIFKDVDELLFPDTREILCNKIKSLLLIFVAALTTSIIIELALKVITHLSPTAPRLQHRRGELFRVCNSLKAFQALKIFFSTRTSTFTFRQHNPPANHILDWAKKILVLTT